MNDMQRPSKATYGSRNEDEIDVDLLVNLLETFRYGKMFNPTAGEIGSEATTNIHTDEEEDNGDGDKSHVVNSLAHESTTSVSSGSDARIENAENQTGSTERNGDISAANSASLPTTTEQLTTEGREIEIEEEKNMGTETPGEPDIEELLAEQERYDLFCPNCYSCITKRVILKKRERGQHGSPVELKPEKPNEPEKKVPAVFPDTDVEDEEPLRLVDGHDGPDSERGKPPPYDSDPKTPIETESFNNASVGGAEEDHHHHDSSKEDEGEANLESENIRPSDSNPISQEQPSTPAKASPSSSKLPSNPLMRVFWWRKQDSTIHEISDKDTLRVTLIHPVTSTSDATTRPQEQEENRVGLRTEILKSIVYGGLTETIASLSVVSSAASSSASTLNILALGIASLVGGLIVLAHNIRDLRNEDADLVSRPEEEQHGDRYNELLGRRENFRFHVLIAVLSYILFGLIPPLVYAFFFNQTGIRNHAIVSVISISLVCIVLLSMMKAYVREPTKCYIKSVACYVGTAVASSGISYVVGDTVAKLGWFDVNQTDMTSVLEGIKPVELNFASF